MIVMKLYLVQHAEPKSKEDDPTRPLSEKGWKTIRKTAKYAQDHLSLNVNQVVHSGKLRADQTAKVLAKHLTPTKETMISKDLEPLADPKIWQKQLMVTNNDMMLVGHLPHLSKLASSLLFGNVDQNVIAFKMGGIICLQRDQQNRWIIQWIITPEILS